MGAKRRYQKRSHSSTEGFRATSNPELAQWMAQLRQSSAASRHLPKPRKGSRAERERQAIRDQNRDEC